MFRVDREAPPKLARENTGGTEGLAYDIAGPAIHVRIHRPPRREDGPPWQDGNGR